MLYMIVERFRNGDPVPVYRRFRDHGRRLPDGLAYVASWVTLDMTTCYQVMECEERRLLDPIRAEADVIVDTSDLSLRQLRERLFAQLATTTRPDQLAVQLITFGYKYGIPLESDLVFDVRFIPNPYYVDALRPHSGLTPEVRDYVMGQPMARRFISLLQEFLDFTIPAYVDEGKTRLTIGLGCTGGYHRSIVLAEVLAEWLRQRDPGPVAVFHRELERT